MAHAREQVLLSGAQGTYQGTSTPVTSTCGEPRQRQAQHRPRRGSKQRYALGGMGGFLDGESFGLAGEDLAEFGVVAVDGSGAVFKGNIARAAARSNAMHLG